MSDQPDLDHDSTGEVRPFAAVLQEIRKGNLHAELSLAVQEVVRAVKDTNKAGSVTLTLQIKPLKDNPDVLTVLDDVKVKRPVETRKPSIYFGDDEGNLTRSDPRQDPIPGVRLAGTNERNSTTQTRKAN